MSIVLVGGHDGMHEEYKEICSRRGHRVKVYTQMPARFGKAIGNPDGIVLFTGTVSHTMVMTAIKKARQKSIPVLRCHNKSVASLEELLRRLEERFARC